MKLQGKVAAITGSGNGIGLEAAKLFAGEGAKVYVLEVNSEAGKQAALEIRQTGGYAEFVLTDVSDDHSVASAFTRIVANDGRLDILYNNASVFLGNDDTVIADLAPPIWKRIIAINLDSIFHCCRHAIPIMLSNGGGSIINTSSSAGIIGIPGCDAYTASKGATVSLTRSMAVEYGPYNIRVNCIAPAAILTDMVRESNLNKADFDEQKFLSSGTPLRRWGLPSDIAQIALFLASDSSSYINGAIIPADGGITIT